MREIKAGEFKAKCLALLDEVAETGEPIVVTKRGKPIATLSPAVRRPQSLVGCMSGSITIVDPSDELEPTPAEAEAIKERLERLGASASRSKRG